MRYPPDKNRNEVLSERDIVSSNAALNTVFGGTRKSWMGGGTGVRPTERSKVSSRIIAPQNSRTSTGILPSPARSDEPSPILRDSHPQPQQDTQTRERASPQIKTPGQPVQIIASPAQVTPVQDGTAPLPQNYTNQYVQNSPLLSPSPPSTEPSQPPPSSLNGQPPATAGTFLARNSQTNSATSLPGASTAAASRLSQTRENRSGSSQNPQRSVSPHINVPHQRPVATQTTQSPMTAMSSNAGPAPFWEGGDNLQRQLIAAEVHSNLPSSRQQEDPDPQIRQQQVPLPSTMIQPQQSRGTDTFAARPAKRQRIGAPILSLKSKMNMIDQQIRSLAHNPSSSLEYPRYSLLREACDREDSFYVALHQLFCLWGLEHEQGRPQVVGIPGFPGTDVLRVSFGILSLLIRENTALLADHKTWFANFPSPLNLLITSEPYMRAVDNVGNFLEKLQTQWISLTKEVDQRKYPPLVDEMVTRLGLLSPVLQQVVFTASRRNLGFGDDALGHYMESLFVRDRDEHLKLSARINTAQPPTAKEIEARNLTLQNEYAAAYSRLSGAPPVVSSASSPVIQNTPGHLPSNGHPVRPDNNHFPNPNFSVQQSGPYPQQQLRMVSNSSPVLSTLASHGRPGSIGGHQSYQSTPSPTLLQGLSMHSPVQQGFPSALRNDNSQASNGPMNQLPNQPMQQYTTPQLQQIVAQQQAVISQQQQQMQLQHQHNRQGQQQQQYYRPPPAPRMSQAQNAHTAQIQYQQAFQQQQAMIRHQQQQKDMSRQQNRPEMQQQQHVINFNRTAEIRRDSAPMINTQNHIRSRNSSISTNGRQTPVNNSSTGQSPHLGANLELQTRNAFGMGSASPNTAMQPRGPQQGMPRIKGIEGRYLFPPSGMRPQQTTTNPEQTALHQSHLRSPLLRVASVSHLEKPQEDPNCRHYQVVTRLAFGPSKLTHGVPLIKFNFEISSEDLKRIPKDHVYGLGKAPMRELKAGSLQYRLRCIQANADVTACLPANWVVSDTYWPEGIFLAINTQQLEIRRKFHHNKDMPIDITQSVLDSHSKTQEVTVSIPEWGPKTSTYLFAVEVIEVLQHKQIMEMCQQQRKSASQTIDTIKRILAPQFDDDDDFAMVSSDLVIGLADPFMAQIFKIPVRGSTCKHHECFDLETFLLTRVSKPKRPQQPCMADVWKCPLCSKDARPCSLIVDDFLLSVREELARQDNLDVKAIMVAPDGTWKAKHEPAPKRRANRDPYDDDPTDDEADGNDTVTPEAAPKKTTPKVIEIIDLDDD